MWQHVSKQWTDLARTCRQWRQCCVLYPPQLQMFGECKPPPLKLVSNWIHRKFFVEPMHSKVCLQSRPPAVHICIKAEPHGATTVWIWMLQRIFRCTTCPWLHLLCYPCFAASDHPWQILVVLFRRDTAQSGQSVIQDATCCDLNICSRWL